MCYLTAGSSARALDIIITSDPGNSAAMSPRRTEKFEGARRSGSQSERRTLMREVAVANSLGYLMTLPGLVRLLGTNLRKTH